MANPKMPESDKKTGDKFEPLIDRATGSDRKRPKSAEAGKKEKETEDDEDDVELDDEDDDEEE